MFEHIEKNFKYPQTAWDLDLESLVRIRFVINENGEVDNIIANAAVVGISFIENQVVWHHKVPTETEFQDALTELDKQKLSFKND